MSVLLAAIGLVLLALPHAFPGCSDVERDSRWSIAGTGIGLRLVELAAVMAATPTMLRALGIHSMADACHRLASPIGAGGAPGTLLTVAAFLLLFRTAWIRVRIRRGRSITRIEPALGEHRPLHPHPGVDLVIVPTTAWVAYSVPGSPHQVVISGGVRDQLTSEALEALVRHEVAHLQLRHHRALRLLAELDGVAGRWVRTFTDRLRLALERAADEVASRACGTTSLREALAAGGGGTPDPTMVLRQQALDLGSEGSASLLPASVLTASATALLAFVAAAAVAEHGVWGILGICGV